MFLPDHTLATPSRDLPALLREARRSRRLSQLELSLRVGISQRHVSFVETGRSKPSRETLVAWLQELGMPLAQRNATMLQAGFAPIYSQQPLDAAPMQSANAALTWMLKVHDPMPAFVLDAQWNVLQTNQGGRWLAMTLLPCLAASLQTPGAQANLLDVLCHPDGYTKHLRNLAEVGPMALAHLREVAALQADLAPKVEAFAALLAHKLGLQRVHAARPQPHMPLLTSRYNSPHGELAFFSMFTTFGTPQDITLASLRVEHILPADAHTQDVLDRLVKNDIASSHGTPPRL